MTYGRCNLTTCRYNFDRKCTDKWHRQQCVEAKHSEQANETEYKRMIADMVVEEWQMNDK